VKKLLTIRTMLPSPVQAGRRWWAVIGAAGCLPWVRQITPRTTRATPGSSLPITVPLEESSETRRTRRPDTSTPPQKSTMMISAV
jgi:hypothetical protein